MQEDQEFFSACGIKVHALEMTRYQCADANTAEILSQIIQETTSRLNRLSQAESENEVSIFRTQGQLEQSQLNSDLVKIQLEQSKQEANVGGMAEADRVSTFWRVWRNRSPNWKTGSRCGKCCARPRHCQFCRKVGQIYISRRTMLTCRLSRRVPLLRLQISQTLWMHA